MGGQIGIQGAAYYPQVEAVWADGPGMINAKDTPSPTNWATFLTYPGNWLMDWFMSASIHRPVPPGVTELIGTIEPRPVMLVAGEVPRAAYGPESTLTRHLYAYAGPHTQLWIIPEVTHCDGPARRPEEYAQKMVEFFDSAFGIER
jgi:hypothetical protein